MILKTMLPSVLKELVKHVPTVLFKVVDWGDLASEFPKISRRLIQKEGHAELFQHQVQFLKPLCINLSTNPVLKMQVTKWSGTKLLELYFAQLFSEQGLFLDLRSINFSQNETEFTWHPTGFWTQFSPTFRNGLLEVYEGFYLQDECKYLDGLRDIGLLDNKWSEADKQHLAELFRAQFGTVLNEPMAFELSKLRDAILGMSEFMLKKEVIISKDFLYLGIYLVTLYAHLEESGDKYPVKEIYLKIKNQFQSNAGPA